MLGPRVRLASPLGEYVVPKSSIRKKKVYTPPAEVRPGAVPARRKPSSPWLPASAVALIVFGIAWLVVFYVTQGEYPAVMALLQLGGGLGAMVGSLASWHAGTDHPVALTARR